MVVATLKLTPSEMAFWEKIVATVLRAGGNVDSATVVADSLVATRRERNADS